MRIISAKFNRLSTLFVLSSLLVTCGNNTTIIATPAPTDSGTLRSQTNPSQVTVARWTNYFGLSGANPDNIAPWVRSVRSSSKIREKVDSSSNNPNEADILQGSMANKVDVVRVMGQDAINYDDQGTVEKFLTQIKRDSGKLYKSQVYNTAISLAKSEGNGHKVYWQMGNEITKQPFSRNINRFNGNNVEGSSADTSIIPTYTEAYLAPGVESLNLASQTVFKSEKNIPIMLGSIGNAYASKNMDFLNSLLAYKVQGNYSKSLQGKRVADIIDFVSIHYLITAVDDDSWMDTIDKFRSQWMSNGTTIKGIWLTEELGRKRGSSGRGATTTIRVASRFLHYMSQRAMTPLQARCFFWGWNMGPDGTKGSDALQALYSFIGDTPLIDLSSSINLNSKSDFESYLFQSKVDPSKKVMMLMPWEKTSTIEDYEAAPQKLSKDLSDLKRNERQKLKKDKLVEKLKAEKLSLPSLKIQSLMIKSNGWSSNKITASLHLFSADQGNKIIPVSVRKEGDYYRILIPNNVSFTADQTAAQLFLQETK